MAEGEAISPRVVSLDGGDDIRWPLAEVQKAETPQVVPDLAARFGAVPRGPWSDPPNTAVVLPIPSARAHQPAGLLVAGVSARLKFDEQYRGFLELVAGQIGTAVANARAYEEEKKRAEALRGARSGEDGLLLQRLARVPHAADPDAGPGRGRSRGPGRALAPRAA